MVLGRRISAFSVGLQICYLLCGGTMNGQRGRRGTPEEVDAAISELMNAGHALAEDVAAFDFDPAPVMKVMHWIANQDATKLGVHAPLVPDLSAVTGELAALAMRARAPRPREAAARAQDAERAQVEPREVGVLLSDPQRRVYDALRRRLARGGSQPALKTLARDAKVRDASVRGLLDGLVAIGLVVRRSDGSMSVRELPGARAEP